LRSINGRWLVLLVVALMLPLGFSGCGEDKQEKAPPKEKEAEAPVSKIVATVGEAKIGVEELKAFLASRPLRPDQAGLKEMVKERLGELITAEVLYQEALRLKLDRKPEIQRKIRQILSQELLEEQVQKPVRAKTFSEEELKRYFDEHMGEYSRPEQVRLADIFIAVPEGATPEKRKAKRERAEEVLAKALEAKDKRFGFAELVRKYSDKHPRFRLGDTGFFDREGKPVGLDPALAAAAFTL
jgi:peptidyl-prolyl cis-trans isomerase C